LVYEEGIGDAESHAARMIPSDGLACVGRADSSAVAGTLPTTREGRRLLREARGLCAASRAAKWERR
jgi:hypothetical protein